METSRVVVVVDKDLWSRMTSKDKVNDQVEALLEQIVVEKQMS
jgi:hypothetical protein